MSKGGWGGFSVPGHSGTQRKHRRAFAKREAGVAQKRRTQGKAAIVEAEPKKTLNPFKKWLLRGLLAVVAIGIVWVSIGLYQSITTDLTSRVERVVTAEQLHSQRDYAQLLELAQGELEGGQYDAAIEDFQRLLEYQADNQKALAGLVEALTQVCAEEKRMCEELSSYQRQLEMYFPDYAPQ